MRCALGGFANGLFPLTPLGDMADFVIRLRTPARMNTLASSVGATFGATGAIHFEARDASEMELAGVTVTGPTGATIAYFTGPGVLSTAATATGATGHGYIFGVAPGEVTLTFTAPGLTCERKGENDWDPPGTAKGTTMLLPVRAGAVTKAAVRCK